MKAPELDWSFSDAPRDASAPGEALPAPRPPAPPPRRPLPRRLIMALAAAAALLGAGAWLFTRLGLLRLQSQLAAQIVYEDQRARAGDVAAVLALQAADQPDWRSEQAARVRLGLAAPLPAGDLLPAGTPPRLARLDPLGGDLFAATVTRDYVDSSGQTYAFDLVQRYRNTSPGVWDRLPPDTTALTPTTLFEGQRLTVVVPTIDLPWLGPALLQADAFIVQACQGWGTCPAGQRIRASFGATPELAAADLGVANATAPSLAAVRNASRQTGMPGAAQPQRPPASYPRIFDLAAAPAADRAQGYRRPAPLLAGRPHDAAAQAALARSLSVALLGDFAGELAGAARTDDDYFLDALVARAEVRQLGASAAPQPLAPQDDVPLAALWAAAGQSRGPASGWRTELAARREALDFLNFALAGQTSQADGRLLRTLHSGDSDSLGNWLGSVLGGAAPSMPDQWTARTLAAFAARPVTDWARYDGLLLACQDGLYQVQGKSLNFVGSLPQGPGLVAVWLGERSPNGRYLPITVTSPNTDNAANVVNEVVLVADLQAGGAEAGVTTTDLANGGAITVLGWTATSQLLYAVPGQDNQTGLPAARLLMAYSPAGSASYRIIPDWIDPTTTGPADWSADHSALVLQLVNGVTGRQPQVTLARLTFTPAAQLQHLAAIGDTAALSPDGRRVAYASYDGPTGAASSAIDPGIERLNVLDTASGDASTLAATNDLDLPPGIARFWSPRWSADGQTLAWHAYPLPEGGATPSYVLSASAGGGPVRVWAGGGQRQLDVAGFSRDGRYLLAAISQDVSDLTQYWLFDQQAAGVPAPLTGWATATAWSPSGHQLVLAGPAGVSALDPASGQWEWLAGMANCQLRW